MIWLREKAGAGAAFLLVAALLLAPALFFAVDWRAW